MKHDSLGRVHIPNPMLSTFFSKGRVTKSYAYGFFFDISHIGMALVVWLATI